MAKMRKLGVPYVTKDRVKVSPDFQYERSNKWHKGKTVDWKKDKERKAKHPGKRVTEWGSTYYEKRANRSDVNRKINL